MGGPDRTDPPLFDFSDDELTELPSNLEDTQDDPTDIRPAAMLEALESAIAHAFATTADPGALIPSLLRMGGWLGFTEHEVTRAIGDAIERDPDPTLDPEGLSRVAADTVSAVQLVERETVHVVERMPMLASEIAPTVYRWEDTFPASLSDETTLIDVSPFLLEITEDAASTWTSPP
jgi:hypothetical protein